MLLNKEDLKELTKSVIIPAVVATVSFVVGKVLTRLVEKNEPKKD